MLLTTVVTHRLTAGCMPNTKLALHQQENTGLQMIRQIARVHKIPLNGPNFRLRDHRTPMVEIRTTMIWETGDGISRTQKGGRIT